jgi:hypothetical protein
LIAIENVSVVHNKDALRAISKDFRLSEREPEASRKALAQFAAIIDKSVFVKHNASENESWLFPLIIETPNRAFFIDADFGIPQMKEKSLARESTPLCHPAEKIFDMSERAVREEPRAPNAVINQEKGDAFDSDRPRAREFIIGGELLAALGERQLVPREVRITLEAVASVAHSRALWKTFNSRERPPALAHQVE